MKKNALKQKWALSIFLLVAIALFLSCKKKEDEKNFESPPVLTLEAQDFILGRSEIVPLSFFTLDGMALGIERRQIIIPEGKTRAEAAIEALLEGPLDKKDFLRPLFSNEGNEWKIKLKSVYISNGVANVNLSNASGGVNDEAALVKARTAIANTLIDYLGVEYVNVFFNGRTVNYSNVIFGAMSRFEGNPESLRQQEKMSFPVEIPITLYFPDKENKALLCQVRNIRFDEETSLSLNELSEEILNELLINGPQNNDNMKAFSQSQNVLPGISRMFHISISHKLRPLNAQAFEEGDGQKAGKLDLKTQKTLSIEIYLNVENEALCKEAVIRSILSVVSDPDLLAIDIEFTKEPLLETTTSQTPQLQNQEGFEKEEQENLAADYTAKKDFIADLENSKIALNTVVRLYCPMKEERFLKPVESTIESRQSENPKAILNLVAKESAKDDRLASILPDGTTEKDILGANISTITAIVDISQNLYDHLEAADERQQWNFLFSVSASLCQIEGVRNVQFFVEGKGKERIGDFVIASPILPDWGRMQG